MDKDPFGPDVSSKLSLATEDIEEAGKCLALQRPTACAFHLMRVMELALQSFGTKLGIVLVDSRGREKMWQNILDEANKAIKGLDQNVPETKKYAELAALLYNVKHAFRNDVMHPKKTYTRDEALNLMNAVRVFLEGLVFVL